MALRVGHRCPLLCAYAEQVLPDAIRRMAELRAAKVNGKECIRALFCVVNGQLRTGADKGNLTV